MSTKDNFIEFSADYEPEPIDFYREVSGGTIDDQWVLEQLEPKQCVVVEVPDVEFSARIAESLHAQFVEREPYYVKETNKSYVFGIAPDTRTFVIMQSGDYRKSSI